MPSASDPTALLLTWMGPLLAEFTAPAARHALVLVIGALRAPARRTVAAALRAAGCGQAADFTSYHRVVNRNRWSPRHLAQRLLLLLVQAFAPEGPVVIGIDDTLERRWGAKIKARGIYRDPVRSSHGHFVKTSGLRWLSVMRLPPIPWAGRVWALPFLTVLAPSERYAQQYRRRHKKLTDWGRQALLQVARWLPGRHIVAVADSRYAAIDLTLSGTGFVSSLGCAWTPAYSIRRPDAGREPSAVRASSVAACRACRSDWRTAARDGAACG